MILVWFWHTFGLFHYAKFPSSKRVRWGRLDGPSPWWYLHYSHGQHIFSCTTLKKKNCVNIIFLSRSTGDAKGYSISNLAFKRLDNLVIMSRSSKICLYNKGLMRLTMCHLCHIRGVYQYLPKCIYTTCLTRLTRCQLCRLWGVYQYRLVCLLQTLLSFKFSFPWFFSFYPIKESHTNTIRKSLMMEF